jgi:hypothetical protein
MYRRTAEVGVTVVVFHADQPDAKDAFRRRSSTAIPFRSKTFPPHQGDHAHPADLPFLRRRHPRPCLLLVPRARCKKHLDDLLRQAGLAPQWKDLLPEVQVRIRHHRATGSCGPTPRQP